MNEKTQKGKKRVFVHKKHLLWIKYFSDKYENVLFPANTDPNFLSLFNQLSNQSISKKQLSKVCTDESVSNESFLIQILQLDELLSTQQLDFISYIVSHTEIIHGKEKYVSTVIARVLRVMFHFFHLYFTNYGNKEIIEKIVSENTKNIIKMMVLLPMQTKIEILPFIHEFFKTVSKHVLIVKGQKQNKSINSFLEFTFEFTASSEFFEDNSDYRNILFHNYFSVIKSLQEISSQDIYNNANINCLSSVIKYFVNINQYYKDMDSRILYIYEACFSLLSKVVEMINENGLLVKLVEIGFYLNLYIYNIVCEFPTALAFFDKPEYQLNPFYFLNKCFVLTEIKDFPPPLHPYITEPIIPQKPSINDDYEDTDEFYLFPVIYIPHYEQKEDSYIPKMLLDNLNILAKIFNIAKPLSAIESMFSFVLDIIEDGEKQEALNSILDICSLFLLLNKNIQEKVKPNVLLEIIFNPLLLDQMSENSPEQHPFMSFVRRKAYKVAMVLYKRSNAMSKKVLEYCINNLFISKVTICAELISLLSALSTINPEYFHSIVEIPHAIDSFVNYGFFIQKENYKSLQLEFLSFISELHFMEPAIPIMLESETMMNFYFHGLFIKQFYLFYTELLYRSFSTFQPVIDVYFSTLTSYIEKTIELLPNQRIIRSLSQILADSVLIFENQSFVNNPSYSKLFESFSKLIVHSNEYPPLANSILIVMCSLLNNSSIFRSFSETIFTIKFDTFKTSKPTPDLLQLLHFLVYETNEVSRMIINPNALCLAFTILSEDPDYMEYFFNDIKESADASLCSVALLTFSKFPFYCIDYVQSHENKSVRKILFSILSSIIPSYFTNDIFNRLIKCTDPDWIYSVLSLLEDSLVRKRRLPSTFAFLNKDLSSIVLPIISQKQGESTIFNIFIYEIDRENDSHIVTIAGSQSKFIFYLNSITNSLDITINNKQSTKFTVINDLDFGQLDISIELSPDKIVAKVNDLTGEVQIDDCNSTTYLATFAINTSAIIGPISVSSGKIFGANETLFKFDPLIGNGNELHNITKNNCESAIIVGMIKQKMPTFAQQFVSNRCFSKLANIIKDEHEAFHLINTLSSLIRSSDDIQKFILDNADLKLDCAVFFEMPKEMFTKELVSSLYILYKCIKDKNLAALVIENIAMNLTFWISFPESSAKQFFFNVIPEIYIEQGQMLIKICSLKHIFDTIIFSPVEKMKYICSLVVSHLLVTKDEKDFQEFRDFIETGPKEAVLTVISFVFGFIDIDPNNQVLVKLSTPEILKAIVSRVIKSDLEDFPDFNEENWQRLVNLLLKYKNCDFLFDFLIATSHLVSREVFLGLIKSVNTMKKLPKKISDSQFINLWLFVIIEKINDFNDPDLIRFVATTISKMKSHSFFLFAFQKLYPENYNSFVSKVYQNILDMSQICSDLMMMIISVFSHIFFYEENQEPVLFEEGMSLHNKLIIIQDQPRNSRLLIRDEIEDYELANAFFLFICSSPEYITNARIMLTKEQFITFPQIFSFLAINLCKKDHTFFSKCFAFYNSYNIDIPALSLFLTFAKGIKNDEEINEHVINLYNNSKKVFSEVFPYEDVEDMDSFIDNTLSEVSEYLKLLLDTFRQCVSLHNNEESKVIVSFNYKHRQEYLVNPIAVSCDIKKIRNKFILRNATNDCDSKEGLVFSTSHFPICFGKSHIHYIECKDSVADKITVVTPEEDIETIIGYLTNEIIVGGFVIQHKDIEYIFERTYKECRGAEIIMKTGPMVFIVFKEGYDTFTEYLKESNLSFTKGTSKVQQFLDGEITIQDLLLYLNFLAGKSFNTPSNYPVFPRIRRFLSSRLPLMKTEDIQKMLKKKNVFINFTETELIPECFLAPDIASLFGLSFKEVEENLKKLSEQKKVNIWVKNVLHIDIPKIEPNKVRKVFNSESNLVIKEVFSLQTSVFALSFRSNNFIALTNQLILSCQLAKDEEDSVKVLDSNEVVIPITIQTNYSKVHAVFLDSQRKVAISSPIIDGIIILSIDKKDVSIFNKISLSSNLSGIESFCDKAVVAVSPFGFVWFIDTTNAKSLLLRNKEIIAVSVSDKLGIAAVLDSSGIVSIVSLPILALRNEFSSTEKQEIAKKVGIFNSGMVVVYSEEGKEGIMKSFTTTGMKIGTFSYKSKLKLMQCFSIGNETNLIFAAFANLECFILDPSDFTVIKKFKTAKPISYVYFNKEEQILCCVGGSGMVLFIVF